MVMLCFGGSAGANKELGVCELTAQKGATTGTGIKSPIKGSHHSVLGPSHVKHFGVNWTIQGQ